MELIFATHNANKVKEIIQVLPNNLSIISLQDAKILEEIPEPFDTIEQNSQTKAEYIFNTYHKNCFSEDTGLIVPSLNGEPGVKSARYAGESANANNNIDLLLLNLKNTNERNAYFKTVITLIIEGAINQFTGICNGKIIFERIGNDGFGYDPIFIPDGSELTFAQMTMESKNRFSHRKKAMVQLITFLDNQKS
jgi:XTP/dITP diphosphohydrolase